MSNARFESLWAVRTQIKPPPSIQGARHLEAEAICCVSGKGLNPLAVAAVGSVYGDLLSLVDEEGSPWLMKRGTITLAPVSRVTSLRALVEAVLPLTAGSA